MSPATSTIDKKQALKACFLIPNRLTARVFSAMLPVMVTVDDLLANPEAFLRLITSNLAAIGITPSFPCDHICWRVDSQARYEELRAHISTYVGDEISEEMVNGRLISVYKLRYPIEKAGYSIDGLELPAPKEGQPYPQGWEHIEFVVDDLESFMKTHPTVQFDTRGLEKADNPTISLTLPSGTVKFHTKHIFDVIRQRQSAT